MVSKKRLNEIENWAYDAWLVLLNIRKTRQHKLQKSLFFKEGDEYFYAVHFHTDNNYLKEIFEK